VPLPLLVVLGGLALCLVLGVAVLGLGSPVALRPEPTPATPVPSPVAPSSGVTVAVTPTSGPVLAGASASADLTAPDNVDGSGRPVSYAAANVLDGDPATTWRATGDARGSRLRIRLAAPRLVSTVGLVNGYPKQDADSGADRYLEERRVTAVTWTFDDGTSYVQLLDDRVRTVQRMAVDPVRTAGVTLQIDATTPPGDADRDYTAISEVQLFGA
jgi:hypothetical protein